MENLPTPGREPDCSLKNILRAGAIVATFVLEEMEKERREKTPKESRYREFTIKPASQFGKQKSLPVTVLGATLKQRFLDILPR